MAKPLSTEHAAYQQEYIDKVEDGDIIQILKGQPDGTFAFFNTIPADKAGYAYADGKWTIKQVLGHLIDTERILTYRALTFARKDATPLPGFEQDDYVASAHHNDMEMTGLAEEFSDLRKANMYLFRSFTSEEKKRAGLANGNRLTVNALLYIIAGHPLHHIGIIKERYL